MDILAHEEAVLLPDREALSFLTLQFAHVTAINAATSVQTLTAHSNSVALAGQSVVVIQH